MNSHFCSPPVNLSDQVIGPVIQRKNVSSSYGGGTIAASTQETQLRSPTVNDFLLSGEKDDELTTLDKAKAALKGAQEMFLRALHQVSQTRYGERNGDLIARLQEDVHQLQGSRTLNEALTHFIDETKGNATMSALGETQMLFIRALRRVRQILYRRKKKNQVATLQQDIFHLKGEIDKMEQRQRALLAAIPPKENVWSAALEYFRVFRYGLQPTAAASEWEIEQAMKSCTQLDFVRASMVSNVIFNGQQGTDAVMKNWACLSLWFKDVSIVIERLEKKPSGSVIAVTCTSVTITEKTLHKVFPHLPMQYDSQGWLVSTLANKLLGQRIVMRGSTHFEWDSGYGRVSSIRAQSDMLTPMLGLLGHLEDVGLVFDKALITPDFQLRSIA